MPGDSSVYYKLIRPAEAILSPRMGIAGRITIRMESIGWHAQQHSDGHGAGVWNLWLSNHVPLERAKTAKGS